MRIFSTEKELSPTGNSKIIKLTEDQVRKLYSHLDDMALKKNFFQFQWIRKPDIQIYMGSCFDRSGIPFWGDRCGNTHPVLGCNFFYMLLTRVIKESHRY